MGTVFNILTILFGKYQIFVTISMKFDKMDFRFFWELIRSETEEQLDMVFYCLLINSNLLCPIWEVTLVH